MPKDVFEPNMTTQYSTDPHQISQWLNTPKPSESAYPATGVAVLRGTEVLAVCVVFFNPDLQLDGQKVACFGHFESKNNPDAVHALMAEARRVARMSGCTQLIGPMDGSTWETYRWAIDRPDWRYLLDLQHPEYYPRLLEQAGFQPLREYTTNLDSTLRYDVERAITRQVFFEKKGMTWRGINLDRLDEELAALHRFCLDSFRDNYLFTPIEAERFAEKYRAARSLMHPRYVLLAEDAEGILRGFVFAVPNLLDTTRKGLVLKTIARDSSFRYSGLGFVLGHLLYQQAIEDGFEYIIHAFMEQSNVSNQVSQAFSGIPVKHYRLYTDHL
jgi:hypothetical protein